ncbi:hypothetical protein QVD17_42016 [Tagetes erecta]|uniref:Uncharacterized protein n=1 Tax=Tagetes erecta TaxID=13708 RepID=A0AAD8JL92_TARER|nr:hypothetical protein QVD17_42016 [Tagetes erecta]
MFFHQEHLLVASSSPSPSSAVVGISVGADAEYDKIVLDSVPSSSSGVVVSASVGDIYKLLDAYGLLAKVLLAL